LKCSNYRDAGGELAPRLTKQMLIGHSVTSQKDI
jgi:hypothetical protein